MMASLYKESNPTEIYFTYVGNTIDIIITIAFVCFIWSYFKVKEKTYGLYMILILNICDFIFPIINLLAVPIVRDEASACIFTGFSSGIYHFSLYWTTSIAVFLLLVVKYKRTFNPKKFMTLAALISLIVSLVYPVVIYMRALGINVTYYEPGKFSVKQPQDDLYHKLIYIGIFDIIGIFIPLLITAFCYLNVHRHLTNPYNYPSNGPKSENPRVLWYSFIQLICFLPGIIMDIVNIWGHDYHFGWKLMVFGLHHSWGFLNVLVYWFLRPSEEPKRSQSIDSIPSALSNDVSLSLITGF